MKEISSIATNPCALPTPDGIEAGVELVLVMAEPSYALSNDDHVNRHRVVETVRFWAGPATLRKLSERFKKIADETEKDFACAFAKQAEKTIAKKTNPTAHHA